MKMPFDPFAEIAIEMNKKMEKILSPAPAICICDSQGEINFIHSALKDREHYIREFIKTNFPLIEEGQYSLPISGTLLGFFKMSSKLIFVLYMESGKIGNLLLYRGLLENYRNIIEEVQSDLQSLKELEANANVILKLRQKVGITKPIAVVSEKGEVVIPVAVATTESLAGTEELPGIYPELLERFRNKKFNFQEGIVLQYCKGKLTVEQIVAKSQFSESEVKEIIDQYQKKGWLIFHEKGGVTYTPSKVEGKAEEAVKSSVEIAPTAAPTPQVGVADLSKNPSEVYPELLERFRTKKFNFKEGIVLQYCKGQLSFKEITEKSNFPQAEVLEIIDLYQKKGWLINHPKP